jgi:hypothetical protein
VAAVARRARPLALPAVVGFVLVAPSFAWVAIDRSIWAWDESYYGYESINLWATLRLDPASWWHAMTHVLPTWPPAIAWFGQFFVPLGGVFGSDRVALLLSTEVTLAVSIALLFAAGLRLSDGRRLAALAGALAAASAPLLVNLSHLYLVEPIQTLSVVWVLFVMVSARTWHISLTIAQLGAALSFGLLTKLSTPVYVAVPSAVALILSFRHTRGRPPTRWWRETSFVASALLVVALVVGAAAWYSRNLGSALDHAKLSATSTLWGTQASFGSHLSYWVRQLRDAFLLPYFDIGLLALLCVSAIVLLTRRETTRQVDVDTVLVLVGCLGVPVAALALLANQVNIDVRFVTPALPAIALGLVAVLRIVDDARVTTLAVVVFAGQFALMTWQSFDTRAPTGFVRVAYRNVPVSESAFVKHVDRLVQEACSADTGGRYNTIGTNYAWLNQNNVAMLAAEQGALEGRTCNWAGIALPNGKAAAGWQELVRRESPYVLTVDYGNPANRLPAALVPGVGLSPQLDRAINGTNVAFLRQVLRSDRYTVVPGSRRQGLILLRLPKP